MAGIRLIIFRWLLVPLQGFSPANDLLYPRQVSASAYTLALS